MLKNRMRMKLTAVLTLFLLCFSCSLQNTSAFASESIPATEVVEDNKDMSDFLSIMLEDLPNSVGGDVQIRKSDPYEFCTRYFFWNSVHYFHTLGYFMTRMQSKTSAANLNNLAIFLKKFSSELKNGKKGNSTLAKKVDDMQRAFKAKKYDVYARLENQISFEQPANQFANEIGCVPALTLLMNP